MITVQCPDTTYNLLNKGGIHIDSLSFYSRKLLCEVLKVDGIITVHYTIFKKHSGTEATLLSMASIAGSVVMRNNGYYGITPLILQTGTEIISKIITIHHADVQPIYLSKGFEDTFTNLNPDKWRNRKNLRDFPYKN